MLVFASPVTLRYSLGAVIFGSNVSMCVGPPESQSQTTEVSLVDTPEFAASARAASRPGNPRLSQPQAPHGEEIAPALAFAITVTTLSIQRQHVDSPFVSMVPASNDEPGAHPKQGPSRRVIVWRALTGMPSGETQPIDSNRWETALSNRIHPMMPISCRVE